MRGAKLNAKTRTRRSDTCRRGTAAAAAAEDTGQTTRAPVLTRSACPWSSPCARRGTHRGTPILSGILSADFRALVTARAAFRRPWLKGSAVAAPWRWLKLGPTTCSTRAGPAGPASYSTYLGMPQLSLQEPRRPDAPNQSRQNRLFNVKNPNSLGVAGGPAAHRLSPTASSESVASGGPNVVVKAANFWQFCGEEDTGSTK